MMLTAIASFFAVALAVQREITILFLDCGRDNRPPPEQEDF